jgi:AraC-like DNA-binding protein
VAAESNLSSASNFCRVFNRHRNISPYAWHQRMLRRSNEPGPDHPSVAPPPARKMTLE